MRCKEQVEITATWLRGWWVTHQSGSRLQQLWTERSVSVALSALFVVQVVQTPTEENTTWSVLSEESLSQQPLNTNTNTSTVNFKLLKVDVCGDMQPASPLRTFVNITNNTQLELFIYMYSLYTSYNAQHKILWTSILFKGSRWHGATSSIIQTCVSGQLMKVSPVFTGLGGSFSSLLKGLWQKLSAAGGNRLWVTWHRIKQNFLDVTSFLCTYVPWLRIWYRSGHNAGTFIIQSLMSHTSPL